MANTVFKLRRSSVAGKKPTTSDIAIGEQAINLTDRILYSSDGTNVWEIGANNTIVNVTNSITVATNSITNSSGIFTNSINSASFKVGSAAFIANTSGVYTNNNINISYNDRGITFTPLAGGANVGFRQQSDDNFVFYSTNTTNGQRAIFNVYANTISGQGSAFRINVPLDIGSNPIYSNGSIGTNGQILTSNGSATYWATITGTGTVTSVGSGTGLTGGPITSSGTLSVNTGYNFTWSNIHTFQSNVAFTGNNISVVSNTGSILFGGASDQNWKIGRNTGATTKYYYTNNSLDIIAANSNLEGIVFGWTGNSYLETGYAGTFTRLPIYVGNSTVNVSINSTSFTGTANNSSYFGGNLPSYYTDATNITTGTLPYAQLGNNVVNTTGSFTLSGVTTFNANIVLGSSGISANGSYGSAGQSLLSNGSATYWATAGATLNANNTDTQTFYIGLSNASSGAWTNAVVSTTKLYYVPSTGKLDASIVNAASHTVGTAFTANSTVVNAVSYYAGTTLIGNTTGPYGKTESNLNVNNALTSNTATYLGNSSATVANVSSWITGNAATAYSNAVSYVDGKSYVNTAQLSGNLSLYQTSAGLSGNVATLAANSATYLGNSSGTISNVASWITSNASAAYSNAVSYVDGLKLDSVTNTSITYIPVANTVKNAYDRAIDANTRAASAQSAATSAYSNAVSYTDSKIATANSAITGNAATAYSNAVSYVNGLKLDSVTNTSITYIPVANTVKNAYDRAIDANTRAASAQSAAVSAYSNAVSYVDGKIATANSAITGNAATAYTNAVSYVDGLKLDSVTNTSITYIPVANTVKNAYDRAIDANTRAASAQSAAVSAYSNAVSYVDGKIATANSAITGNAATAYSNSVSYTDGKIATANSAITGNAATAYSNATVFASNASNINTGTLAEARLPYRMDQNVRTTDNVSFSSLTLTGSLSISGNVNVIGSNTLSIVDNFIYLNSNNTVDNEDLGIVGNYNTTGNSLGYAHSGIFRDASDGIWKVFDGYKPEPDANVNIDTTNTTFQLANFQANTLYLGNTSTNWLVANIGGMYHTGTVNAASHTVGTAFTANATMTNTVSLVVSTNTATFGTAAYHVANGNFGIGNSAPADKLSVNGSAYLGGGYTYVGGFNTATYPTLGTIGTAFSWNFSAGHAEVNIWNPMNPTTYANTGFRFMQQLTASTYRDLMYIKQDGNVGIGTTAPLIKLQVAGNMGVDAFVECSQNVATSYTITTGKNAMSAGPISINSGVTITVPSGSTWTIV